MAGQRWYALSGALLGAGFLTREASSVLFALPLAARMLTHTPMAAAPLLMAAYGLPFVLLYLTHNAQPTAPRFVAPHDV